MLRSWHVVSPVQVKAAAAAGLLAAVLAVTAEAFAAAPDVAAEALAVASDVAAEVVASVWPAAVGLLVVM